MSPRTLLLSPLWAHPRCQVGLTLAGAGMLCVVVYDPAPSSKSVWIGKA